MYSDSQTPSSASYSFLPRYLAIELHVDPLTVNTENSQTMRATLLIQMYNGGMHDRFQFASTDLDPRGGK